MFEYLNENFTEYGIEYQFIYCDKLLNDEVLSEISVYDYLLWEPIIAFWNIDYLKLYINSVVILSNPTLLVQKISNKNPINESTAINIGFYILYMDPDDIDITNDDWKVALPAENYVIPIDKLRKLIYPNVKEQIEINVPNIRTMSIDEIQVNLS
jgi:hypothetical protein